jgi:hypothetical protein
MCTCRKQHSPQLGKLPCSIISHCTLRDTASRQQQLATPYTDTFTVVCVTAVGYMQAAADSSQ